MKVNKMQLLTCWVTLFFLEYICMSYTQGNFHITLHELKSAGQPQSIPATNNVEELPKKKRSWDLRAVREVDGKYDSLTAKGAPCLQFSVTFASGSSDYESKANALPQQYVNSSFPAVLLQGGALEAFQRSIFKKSQNLFFGSTNPEFHTYQVIMNMTGFWILDFWKSWEAYLRFFGPKAKFRSSRLA